MTDFEDRLLEVALEEALGGRVPPDLSAAQFRAAPAPPARGRAWGRLSVAAALLLAATVLAWMLLPRPPRPPAPVAPAQEDVALIPPVRIVSLDFPGGTLKEAADRLSQAAGYPIAVAAAVAGVPVPAVRLKDVPFLEAMDAVVRPLKEISFTSRPGQPVSVGSTRTAEGVSLAPIAQQIREGVGLYLFVVGVPGLARDVNVALEIEPSHDRLRLSEIEILEIRDDHGAEPALKTRTIPLVGPRAGAVGFTDGCPGRLAKLRLRARLHYAAEERRIVLTAGREPRSVESDGLRLTASFEPSSDALLFGDRIEVRMERLDGGEKSRRVLDQVMAFARGRVDQLIPLDVPKDHRIGPGFASGGPQEVLTYNVKAGAIKDEVRVEIVLPVAVEVRTLEFDLKDLTLR